ncbi:MAG TPA: calcium-binding protein [Dongiaceae bacterium]|jgi:Ca2+-binding RTX toxin-like protein
MAILYISPTGSGTHSGSSAANAGTLKDLQGFIKKAGPGGEVRLLADKGTYHVTNEVTLSAGGASGAPVTIRGVSSSGATMSATFTGTRASTWKPGLANGEELFRLIAGANHLKFTDLTAKNFGDGIFRVAANITDLSVNHVNAANVTRFIETMPSSPATTASVSWLKVENSSVAGYSKNAIRLGYNSNNITISHVTADSMKQDGGLVMAGLMLEGTVHDVLLDHVTMKNNYGHGSSGEYWNGDGFLAERGTYNIKFVDTYASGNTDAGYDIKSNNVTFLRAASTGNTKDFKLWGTNVTMTDSVSTNPKYFGGTGKTSHLFLASGAKVTLDNFAHTDSVGNEVFDMGDGGSTLKLVNTALPSASVMHLGNNSVIQLPNGLYVNGTPGADMMAGGSGNDTLIGGKGNDTYIVNASGDKPVEEGTEGTDLVKTTLGSYTLGNSVEKLSYIGTGNFTGTGNTSANTITGGSGNDWLTGGTGNDTLTGGGGADTYVFRRGDKQDTIYNADSGGTDTLLFGSGIGKDDVWLAHNGNDLLVTIRGTGGSDKLHVKNWYTDSTTHLNLKLGDGSVLAASQVQSLVQAMASFTSSSGAPISMSGTQEAKVETTIAANWKSA